MEAALVDAVVSLRRVVEILARQTAPHRRDLGPYEDDLHADAVSVDLLEWFVLMELGGEVPLCTRTRRDPSTGDMTRCVHGEAHIAVGELSCAFMKPRYRSVASQRRTVLDPRLGEYQVEQVAAAMGRTLGAQGVQLTPQQLVDAAVSALGALAGD